jgi:hypothetical protein
MKDAWVPFVTGALFLAIGIVCLLWPERIQQLSLDYYASHKAFAKLNPFLEWMKKRDFIIALRLIGLMAIGVFLLGVFVVAKQAIK